MEEPSDYDWADDEDLDLEATMSRFSDLEPALVVVRPITTCAGISQVITMDLRAPRREAVTFA
jgi:hypothetical protein